MDGQARSRGTRGPGRTSRAASPWPAAERTGTGPAGRSRSRSRRPPGVPADPITMALYRMLLLRGLEPAEAATLTAFLCGIGVSGHRWSLPEVNRLLFLRQLHRTGRFGLLDGAESH